MEICSKCHPFYTGNEKLMDTAGRVDKFNKRRLSSTSKEINKKLYFKVYYFSTEKFLVQSQNLVSKYKFFFLFYNFYELRYRRIKKRITILAILLAF